MNNILLLTNFLNSSIKAAFEKPWGNYLLEGLAETQAPDSISWWPQTPGWLILLVIFILLSLKRGYRVYTKYKANAYRRNGIQDLSQLSISSQIHQLPALLKKTALTAYGRPRVASLSGKEWDQWLDTVCPECQFSKQCSGLLAQLSYRTHNKLTQAEREQLFEQASLWIRKHRVSHD